MSIAKATTTQTVPDKTERVNRILRTWDASRDLDHVCRVTYNGPTIAEKIGDGMGSTAKGCIERDMVAPMRPPTEDGPTRADKMAKQYANWRSYVISVLTAHNRTI